MDISVLGVDLGKNVCSVVGLDASGAVVMRRKVRRETLIALAEKLPPCIVGMEACCGAHHLGRVCGFNLAALRPAYPIKRQRARRERRHPKASKPGRASPLDPLENSIDVKRT